MKKPDVLRLLRAELDPLFSELGFRWKRMLRSSDGWYVRAWDGGRDTFGWGIASYFPQYSLGAFATLRIDAVEELIAPHVPFSPPEAAREAFSCNVNDLSAFVDGPGERTTRMVQSEDEVREAARGWAALVRERIEPWWQATRTPSALWHAHPSWRKFWGHPPHREMHELALAFLCAPPAEQEQLERQHLAASWPEMYRPWLESLVADLRRRRG